MEQRIVDSLGRNRDGSLCRRDLFARFAGLVGGAAAAYVLLPQSRVQGEIVPRDDPRLHTEWVEYPGQTGPMRAYLARPKAEEKRPAVIVIHENRGLVPHIQDVARRMALEGFLAVAPDALSPQGGTPEDPQKAPPLFQKLDYPATVKNFVAAVKYLKTHPLSTGKVGCTGFCWGGAMTNQVAVNAPDLLAAAPYYGGQPAVEDVPKIKAAMLLHYAGRDERINKGIPAFEKALKEAGIEYKTYVYEGTEHAFNNDTNEARYHKEAAQLAWQRTIAFFKEKLKT
ncbi:MAG TPA: dienelactone hydrolase family protein [Sedimentisphaerales bacterium]|nr:dienelactone hydrolase family protein [Sedimentisphaerales bacterium]